MICPHCAYSNIPTNKRCGYCHRIIQTPEELAEKQKFWSELPDELRVNFEEKYHNAQIHYRKVKSWQRKTTLKYTMIGAIILGIMGLFTGKMFIPDFVIGGVAGWLLNYKKGGPYWSVFFFSIGYGVSFGVRAVHGLTYAPWLAIKWLDPWIPWHGNLAMHGAIFTIAIAYAFGLIVARTHSDRS